MSDLWKFGCHDDGVFPSYHPPSFSFVVESTRVSFSISMNGTEHSTTPEWREGKKMIVNVRLLCVCVCVCVCECVCVRCTCMSKPWLDPSSYHTAYSGFSFEWTCPEKETGMTQVLVVFLHILQHTHTHTHIPVSELVQLYCVWLLQSTEEVCGWSLSRKNN